MKKLSIVIPVYNVSKYLPACLDSVLGQSYRNIEVIAVDDCSPDDSNAIIASYQAKDDRLKLIHHERNRGLFRARLTGIEAATGDYIAFVDSDDFVSCDWFRPLIETLENTDSDMVLGNTINVDAEGNRTYYNNYRSFTRDKEPLRAPDLYRSFFAQHGECFVWHTVWNKVYRADFVKGCMPYFEAMPEPLIMGEDIAFSSVFYTQASALAFCDNDAYFYVRHDEASTSITLPKKAMLRNVNNIVSVFRFVDDYLHKVGLYEELAPSFQGYRDKYFCIWSGNLTAANMMSDKDAREVLLRGFDKTEAVLPKGHEFYFYENRSPWDGKAEEIKYTMLHTPCEVVSFDVFDTLLVRPFWEPTDLLQLVAKVCPSIAPERFVLARRTAEEECRKIKHKHDPEIEDVTLDEIYAYMSHGFGFDDYAVRAYKSCELRLEQHFCYARQMGLDLMRFALAIGKRVVMVSDMYLPYDVVRAMLRAHGYPDCPLYLSSKERKIKATGALFRLMLQRENVEAAQVLHIGDNWQSDVLKADEVGLQTKFLPRAVETFTNMISSIYTGDAFKEVYLGNNAKIDSREFIKQLPLRSMLSMMANHMFDNPFRSFNNASFYNADTYYMGYATFGMHVFDLAHWIYRDAVKRGYETIHFLARDGYVVKQAFDMIVAHYATLGGKSIRSTYFHATRKALFPYTVSEADDLYTLLMLVDYKGHTPRDIVEWCHNILLPFDDKRITYCEKDGFAFDKPFVSNDQFRLFIAYLTKLFRPPTDAKTLAVAEALRRQFEGNCAVFDIGYSGRVQSMLCRLADKPIDVYYVHDNGYPTLQMAEKYGFGVHCYYDFTPTITAIIRETLISETSPGCVGYDIQDGQLVFLFDEDTLSYAETYAIREMHRGAIRFCRDMIERLGDVLPEMRCRAQEASLLFENFLINVTDFDLNAFANCCVEDKVYSGYAKKNLADVWRWHLAQMRDRKNYVVASNGITLNEFLHGKSKIQKALFYFLFDHKTFWKKVKRKLRRR